MITHDNLCSVSIQSIPHADRVGGRVFTFGSFELGINAQG